VKLFAHSNGHDFELEVSPERDRLRIVCNGKPVFVALDDQKSSLRSAFLGDRRLDFGWDRRDGTYSILIDGVEYAVVVRDARSELLAKAGQAAAPSAGVAEVRAPIPGLITRVLLRPGEAVRKDQAVLCLDAMKLENELPAPRDGTVRSVEVRPGQAVEKGQLLFVIG
jgi:biotin carboxyl carrier protein